MEQGRYAVLDGWRGISILCVLAAHLLPVGPKAWQLNSTVGPLGMVLFFTLSGFLITSWLLARPEVAAFAVRRLARIVPLAWLYLLVALPVGFRGTVDLEAWLAHFLFYANWPPMPLTSVTGHFWSLCVEVQFYVAVALLVAVLGRRGLLLLPLLALAVTALRMYDGVQIAINTYYRVDEILAGATLALIVNGKLYGLTTTVLRLGHPLVALPLLVVACHPEGGVLNYFRPYLAALLVGWSIAHASAGWREVLTLRFLVYVGGISYALYVWHPLLDHSWLGSGDTMEKYIKRPLLFAAAFAVAHVSTFYYEARWTKMARSLGARAVPRPAGGS